MNYSNTTSYYQFLSQLIFGRALIDAQTESFNRLSENSDILIAGGGDGEFLKYIKPFYGRLDFLDISEKMVLKARSKTKAEVNWIVCDVFEFMPEHKYDHIIVPFLLDNFNDEQCRTIVPGFMEWLEPDGSIIVIDYTENPNLWQKILLKSMYLFFSVFAGVRVKNIPPMEKIFKENAFRKTMMSKSFYKFIEIKTYRKEV